MKCLLLAVGLALFGALAFADAAMACDREELSERLDEARERLERAGKARTLDDAKRKASTAQSALNAAASVLSLCRCWLGLNALHAAALSAQRASYADDAGEFRFELGDAIREYNRAVKVVNSAGNNSCELR